MKVVDNLKRNAVRITLNTFIVFTLLADSAGLIQLPFINFLENYAYDVRMLIGMQKDKDPRIVIVDIDENSLAAEGRWPWSRDKMARLLDLLFDRYRVSLVGFDVVFAEPDKSSGVDILDQLAANDFSTVPGFHQQLDKIRESRDYDNIFAKSMAGRPVVLGYYFNDVSVGTSAVRSGALPPPVLTRDDFEHRPRVRLAGGYGSNLPKLQQHAAAAGHFNPTVDNDGVVRRVPIFYELDGNYYESLALAMSRLMLGVDKIIPVLADDVSGNYASIEWLRIGRISIPLDEIAQVIVPYRGKQGSFPYVSATDVLNQRANPGVLEDAVVLVGTSAPGLFDLRATPVQNKYPGVEIVANLVAGIIDQNIKEMPKYVRGIEFLGLLILGLIVIFLLPFIAPLMAMLVTFALLVFSIGINYLLWKEVNFVLPIATTVIMILLSFLLNMSYGFFFEWRIKGRITDLFGRYVSPQLVDEMSRNPGTVSMAGDSREMTVLFADVRNFTALAERMEPKLLSALMNELLTALTQVIYKHRGTIDKYIGDCIMAFWGAPVRDTEHAHNAVLAALEMQQVLQALAPDFEKRGWPEIKIGIGINTGRMSVGNMGSHVRVAYTVMGDAVNLAARLEALTRHYGVHILVGEATQQSLPEVVFREVDRVRVKGKGEPSGIYEPIGYSGRMSGASDEELQRYRQALVRYRAQDWEQAEQQFRHLQTLAPHRRLYEIYLERIHTFRAHPPGPEWDGVHMFEAK